jgi:Holliday junction resolvase RusA-like endonuclease
MTEPLIIEFVGDPVAKGRARMSIAGGRPIAYTPAKTRKYEAALQCMAREAMNGRERFLGAVEVSVNARLPVPASWSKKKRAAALAYEIWPTSRPDADNYAKAALDALNAVAFNDDSQVVVLMVGKSYSEKPGLHITVREFSKDMA